MFRCIVGEALIRPFRSQWVKFQEKVEEIHIAHAADCTIVKYVTHTANVNVALTTQLNIWDSRLLMIKN